MEYCPYRLPRAHARIHCLCNSRFYFLRSPIASGVSELQLSLRTDACYTYVILAGLPCIQVSIDLTPGIWEAVAIAGTGVWDHESRSM